MKRTEVLGAAEPATPDKSKGIVISGVASIGLRGLTLAGRLLLVVFLAKAFTPHDVGVYGLFAVTISFALYVVGIDFYSFATRELLGKPRQEWAPVIRDQGIFYLIAYVVALPLFLAIFLGGLLDWELLAWFYLLVALEHLSQEGYRLLVATGKPKYANVVFFLRGGAWVYVLVALITVSDARSSLQDVFVAWAIGTCTSVLVAAYGFRDIDWSTARRVPINWAWLRNGIKVSAGFLVSTLALRGILTVDRYVLKAYWDYEMVGVYTFFMALAGSVQSFVEAGVVSVFYPRLVAASRQGDESGFASELHRMKMSMFVVLLIIGVATAAFVYPLLSFINAELYSEKVAVFWILLVAMAVWCWALIPHYVLYAHGRDRAIIFSALAAFGVGVVSLFFTVPTMGAQGAGISVAFAATVLLVAKSAAAMRA